MLIIKYQRIRYENKVQLDNFKPVLIFRIEIRLN